MGTNLLVGSLYQPIWYSCARSSCTLSSIKLRLRPTPIDGTSTSTGSTTSTLYIGEGEGVSPVEMCIEVRYPCEATVTFHASLCKWMLSSRPSSWFSLAASMARMPSMRENSSGISSFMSSSASDTRNSKLEESTWLMCSTGLLMHDLIIDFDK